VLLHRAREALLGPVQQHLRRIHDHQRRAVLDIDLVVADGIAGDESTQAFEDADAKARNVGERPRLAYEIQHRTEIPALQIGCGHCSSSCCCACLSAKIRQMTY
jgi:hypothetical protein